MTKVGIIGGGNMGAALIKGMNEKFQVSICEKDGKRVQMLKRKYAISSFSLKDLVSASKVIILAVKPQDFDGILDDIKYFSLNKKLIVSIAAGITTTYIEKKLGLDSNVIRTMPNMPALIGEGVTGICGGKRATIKDLHLVEKMFKCVGETLIVEEKDIDAITALSGSGPAYVFYFVECLINAGYSLGLGKEISQKLAYQTLLGSMNLLKQQKEDAASLRAKVTSKGGTTQAALNVLMDQHRLDKIIDQALKAAKKRAEELSRK